MGDIAAPELEDGDSPPRQGRAVIVALPAPQRFGKEPAAAAIAGTPAGEGNAGGQQLLITKWSKILQLVPANETRALFREGDPQHLDGRTCSDAGFMALISRRYQELYSERLNPSRVPSYLAKLCYAEYFLRLELDYPELRASRELMLEKRHVRMRQKCESSVEKLAEAALKARQTIAKRLANNIPKKARSMSSSSLSLITKQLKAAQKELQATRSKCQDAEARVSKANKLLSSERLGTMQKIGLISGSLEEFRGDPLQVSLLEKGGEASRNDVCNIYSNKNNECPVCFHAFTTEGAYRLSCGHLYHVHCLLLHAYASCSCFACNARIPREFYLTFGVAEVMPEPEPEPEPESELQPLGEAGP